MSSQGTTANQMRLVPPLAKAGSQGHRTRCVIELAARIRTRCLRAARALPLQMPKGIAVWD